MKKKLLCILMVLTLALSVTGFAATDSSNVTNDEEVSIRSFECPECGNGILHKHFDDGTWVRTNTWRYCPIHGGSNIQWLYVRTNSTTYKCNECGYGYTESSQESTWMCP